MYSEDAEQQSYACYIYHVSSEHVTNQSPITCNKLDRRHFRLLTKIVKDLNSSSLLILRHSNHISSVNQASCKNDRVKVCCMVATIRISNPLNANHSKNWSFILHIITASSPICFPCHSFHAAPSHCQYQGPYFS